MGHQEIRVRQQNVEAEKSVLGAMLIDEEAIGICVEILDAIWFYEDAHQKIYQATIDLYNHHKKVDIITLSNKLKNDNLLNDVGGVAYLSSIIDFVPTSANVEHYASIVREKGVLRELIKNATQIVTESYDSKQNIETIVD